ncbi:primosomal protein DnaI [Bacillus kwashiorkori]|uniref:primosomal protein DnaI n=1 Tax=Bacillus kwashiorkori TaxID=1522318 RepID=UPI000784DA72|nr:primosomal protein DnaI [Bacillus kwashiorkori]
MEKISDTLKKFKGRDHIQNRLAAMREEILANEDVRRFIAENKNQVTMKMIDQSLNKLYEFISQIKENKENHTLAECPNLIPGYEPKLIINRNVIDIKYVPCKCKIVADELKSREKLIQCIHIPKEIVEATMSEVILDTPNRIKAIDKIEQFITEYEIGNFRKGLYLYGPFGTGKTYLLGVVANELQKKNIASTIVYVPEFIREMKQAISDGNLDNKINALKTAPLLMFDDIGAETVSSWVRDEVIGPILQYRMLEKLPTFFTSNFDLTELEHHLTYSQRGEEEKVKARRIIERIQFLSEPIMIDGKNKRN